MTTPSRTHRIHSYAGVTQVHVVDPVHYVHDCGYTPMRRHRPNEGFIRHARQRPRDLRHGQPGSHGVGPMADRQCHGEDGRHALCPVLVVR